MSNHKGSDIQEAGIISNSRWAVYANDTRGGVCEEQTTLTAADLSVGIKVETAESRFRQVAAA